MIGTNGLSTAFAEMNYLQNLFPKQTLSLKSNHWGNYWSILSLVKLLRKTLKHFVFSQIIEDNINEYLSLFKSLSAKLWSILLVFKSLRKILNHSCQ